ncbi:hypothetical protein PR202_ga29216 [Eleusine coracana subsp. coracana]|uniref:RNase H type-1 domain-containing protein n=1 Tax=Eleusine coracana subsp. coracana TaxID=191504 RepID=A0AAV5DLK2_ELECO|nr:hypothetical protein PR202_ga29216 [Eleusine coracana subsp. coracana]
MILSPWRTLFNTTGAEETEAPAAREGIRLAAEWCREKAILEMDCTTVMAMLRRPHLQKSLLSFIICESIDISRQLPELVVDCVKRERNSVAHELAQLAKRTKHSAGWRLRAPMCVEQTIARECNSISE